MALIKKLKAKGIQYAGNFVAQFATVGSKQGTRWFSGTAIHFETSKMSDMPDVKMNILPVIRDVIEAKGMVIIHTIPGMQIPQYIILMLQDVMK